MKVALCCIGRLENRYAIEYVEYYKNLGIDKIFIYDNNYDGEEHFEDVLQRYIDEGLVEIIDFRNRRVCQLNAYQDCYDKHGNEYDWFAFFDFDEYLTFKNSKIDIKDFLSRKSFNKFDMIHINWMVYDDNDLVYYENKPLVERFKNPKMPLDFKYGYHFSENNHVKSIIRGNRNVTWDSNPHTATINGRCCNADGNKCNENSPFTDYTFKTAWLRHYQTKTIDEWLNNKVRRGYPDRNKKRFELNSSIKEFFERNKKTHEKEKFVNMFLEKNKRPIILSMTTIPMRKDRLSENLPYILNQSYKFDKLVINVDDNLSDEDYQWYNELSKKDSRIEINKAEAKWRSCNKLLPTLKKYPDEVVITIDDDIAYPIDTIRYLVEAHEKNPNYIISHEINPISISKNNDYVTYTNSFDVMLMQKEWGKYFSNCCLFPPHIFDGSDLFDYDKMMECTNGTHDELWFWVNSTINNVQCIGLNYVRSFSYEMLRQYEEGEYQLTNSNNTYEKIEGYMQKINMMYGERLLKNILATKVEFEVTKDNIYAFFFLYPYIKMLYNYGFSVKTDGLTNNWKLKLINGIKHGDTNI